MRTGISVVIMTNDYACCRQGRRRNFGMFLRRSGTDDRRRWRIEVPVSVDDYLGTKAAHGEDQKQDLHPDPEGLKSGHAGGAMTVSPAQRQRQHHKRDDGGLYHQETPNWAAIWRAFCSGVSRGCAWVLFDLDDACFLEAAGLAASAGVGVASAGVSLAAGIRLPMSLACAEAEARTKAEMRISLRICRLPCSMKGG